MALDVAAVMIVARRALVRLATTIALLFALSFALFGVLAQLPGDPIDLLVTSNPNVSADDVVRLKRLRGLDKPWPVQWWRWLVGHQEPLPLPKASAPKPIVVELGPEGSVVVDTPDGKKRTFFTPGVYNFPIVVDDGHGQQDAAAAEVLVSPTISQAPSPNDPFDADIDVQRQLGGSPEHVFASDDELAAAARKVGRAMPTAPPHVVVANEAGDVAVDGKSLCPGAYVQFDVVAGPGAFDANGLYHAHFDGAGRTAVVYEVRGPNGGPDEGAFVVDHGPVLDPDPAHVHRGALYALVGDGEALGYSSTYKRPVVDLLRGRVTNTLSLMLPAFLLSLVVAIPLGTFAASRRGRRIDRAILAAAVVAVSVPAFWLGLMGIVVFAAKLQWLPAGGIETPGDGGFVDRFAHAVLPVAVLTVAYAGQWVRYVRSGVVDVLPSDYVRTARAKGLAPRAVLVRHALRTALVPLITVVALAAPQMFAGALLTETVFAWPGIGRLQYEAVLNNDSYVAIVVFLIAAALVMLSSAAADVLYTIVDPRMRRGRGATR